MNILSKIAKSNFAGFHGLLLVPIVFSASCGLIKKDENRSVPRRNQMAKSDPSKDIPTSGAKPPEDTSNSTNNSPSESTSDGNFESEERDTLGAPSPEEEALAEKKNNRGLFEDRKYELITPTGEILMAAALKWQIEQEKPANAKIFAQPAQCAQNISKVMILAGFPNYTSPLVPGLVAAIKSKGGLIVPLPKDKNAIAEVIAKTFDNKIPTGTLVGGCLYKNCSGEAGDGHIALVGDLDSNGAVKLYHNNWYRPENENGVWKPQMIPLGWYNKGFKRKFMSTSWMNIFRDPPRVGTAYDVSIEVPAIDDLDPTNYYLTLAVPVEVWKEYKNKQGKVLDSDGNQVPIEE
ncbi:MAG: hypothetical protein WCI18_04095 [Pseudomonadota bacterium]